jgi:hypothetical protein
MGSHGPLSVDYEYGRIIDPPDGWRRSRRDNLYFKTDSHLVTIFKYPDRSQYGICVKSFAWEEVRFERQQFDCERDALDHADNILWELEH